MKIGFTNCYTPQRTNFKGLFAVTNTAGSKEWINTDHFVKCKPDDNICQIYLSNGEVILANNNTHDKTIMGRYSLAATSKDTVIDEKGKNLYTKGFLEYNREYF